MKTKKIGIDIRAIGQQRTGDEYYTLNLVRSLLKIDKKNQYYLLTNTPQTEEIKKKIFENLANKNAKIISITPKSKMLWTFFVLPKAVKRLDLDVLHVQYITPLWLPQKTKLITTIADVSFKACPEFINKLDLFFLNLLIPLSLERADKIIAVSEFTKKEIIKYYQIDKNKIKVVHNGDASNLLGKAKKSFKKTLDKIGIKKPYLFYTGTHQPRKDIPTLIKSFFSLKISLDNIQNDLKLVIGGKLKAHNYDTEIDKILTEIKNDPKKKKFINDLIFTGYVDDRDLISLYRGATAFVFPSLYEGFGLPLLEAMAFKISVVCSDIDCFKEVAGNAAYYFKAGDSNELERALLEVLTKKGLRNDLVEKGQKNLKRFSWKNTAKKTLRLFEE